MFRRTDRRQGTAKRGRDVRGSRTHTGPISIHHRRLICEALEDRRLLSIGAHPLELPGMYLVDPSVDRFEGQIVYLDFDGAENVTYNGPVTVPNIVVPAFEAPGDLAGQEHAIIEEVFAQLAITFADTGVAFTADRPASHKDYSTIFVGGEGLAFSQYGKFAGIAEQVDGGNQNPSDIAFVFSRNLFREGFCSEMVTRLADAISHEAGHLLGYAHDRQLSADNGLFAVAGISEVEPNDSTSTADTLTLDSLGKGSVSIARMSSNSDLDFFKITTPSFSGTATLTVVMTPMSSDGKLNAKIILKSSCCGNVLGLRGGGRA